MATLVSWFMAAWSVHAQQMPPVVPEAEFRGMAHASAAAFVDRDHVLVASDEDNVLRLYTITRPGPPLATFDWNPHLGISDREHGEVDIEGAALLDDGVIWIGSHGRNRNGKWRENRHRLFVTRMIREGESFTLESVGSPRHDLALAMLQSGRFAGTSIAAALGPLHKTVPSLAPKRGGFNIEGLASAPGGNTLWIALRSPLEKGKAVLIPLLNPQQLMTTDAPPEFGPLELLDLEGLGIRDMAYAPAHAAYIILAGAPGREDADSALFRWSGIAGEPPMRLEAPIHTAAGEKFNPEVVLPVPEGTSVLLISDDGRQMPDPPPRKGKSGHEPPPGELSGARFRILHVPLPQSP